MRTICVIDLYICQIMQMAGLIAEGNPGHLCCKRAREANAGSDVLRMYMGYGGPLSLAIDINTRVLGSGVPTLQSCMFLHRW